MTRIPDNELPGRDLPETVRDGGVSASVSEYFKFHGDWLEIDDQLIPLWKIIALKKWDWGVEIGVKDWYVVGVKMPRGAVDELYRVLAASRIGRGGLE